MRTDPTTAREADESNEGGNVGIRPFALRRLAPLLFGATSAAAMACGGKVVFDPSGNGGGASTIVSGSSKSSSATGGNDPCHDFCAAIEKANCDGGHNEVACVEVCEQTVKNVGTCASAAQAYFACVAEHPPPSTNCTDTSLCKQQADAVGACVAPGLCDLECQWSPACNCDDSCGVYHTECVDNDSQTESTCTCIKNGGVLGTCVVPYIVGQEPWTHSCVVLAGCCAGLFAAAH